MIHIREQDRPRAALAEEAARALARMTGVAIAPCDPSVVPPPLAEYSYAERPGLMFAHWHRQLSSETLLDAVRELRTDLIMVEPGQGAGEPPTFHVSLLLCRDGEVQLHKGLRLWSIDVDTPLWLVPDPKAGDAGHPSFSLRSNGVTQTDTGPADDRYWADFGIKIAEQRLALEIGGHFV